MLKVFYQYPGEVGIYQTVSMMRDLINKSYNHSWIKNRALKVTEHCQQEPFRARIRCEEDALISYVRTTMKYMKDPPKVEALQDPVLWVEKRLREGKNVYGDCDDLSIYLGSLLKSLGHSPRFRVIGKKDKFHHVLIFCHGRNLDASLFPGMEPKKPGRSIQIAI